MPYKLTISKGEVKDQLEQMGFHDPDDNTVEAMRKDLLCLIKKDLKIHKAMKAQNTEELQTDVSNTVVQSYKAKEDLSDVATKTSKEAQTSVSTKGIERSKRVKKKEPIPEPSYPEKPDPVNLYHFYKHFWDKHKLPGEDPRKELRWEIRTKLFHS